MNRNKKPFCSLFSAALILTVSASLRAAPLATLPWPDLSRPTSKNPGGGAKDAALIVAIERYAFLEDKPVVGARRNANDWHLYLTKTRGVSAENIVFLRDDQASREKILSGAAEVARRAQPGGTVWFLFIGHGAPSPGKATGGMLLGVDVQNDAESLEERGVSQTEVLSHLAKGKQANTVAIVDSCFSGRSNTGSTLVAGLQPIVPVPITAAMTGGAILLTAAQGNEYAGPLPGGNRPAFSYLMLAALRGWGDSNRKGKVTVGEAARYAHRALQTLLVGRHQTPDIVGPADGVVVCQSTIERGTGDSSHHVSTWHSRSRPIYGATRWSRKGAR